MCDLLPSGERLCTRTALLGESCQGRRCAEGVCPFAPAQLRCVSPGALGAACNDDAPCQLDLDCQGTCVAKAGLTGARCTWEYGGCLRFCVFDAPGASEGKCGVPTSVGPSACSMYADDRSPFCPASTYQLQAPGNDADCACLPRLPLGSACDEQHCDHGFCSEGKCVALRAAGVACAADLECEPPLYCDTDRGRCARRASCVP